jgi:glyoxylase-like metal-dependent hydrolase (beta-lactamase superfamily II)
MVPREIAPGVYCLGSEQVNWYLVEDGGSFSAVDAGLPRFKDDLPADLRTLGISLRDIDALVLTHADGDHTGLAPLFHEAGARVLVHEADEPLLRKPRRKGGDARGSSVMSNLWRRPVRKLRGHTFRQGGAKPKKITGAETFRDGDLLDVPGHFRVVHTPGHTLGHCALLDEARCVLFAGDALADHRVVTKGRGPQVMPSYTNVDSEQAIDSLDALERLDDRVDTVVFGHGTPWHDGLATAVASARRRAPRRGERRGIRPPRRASR